jgi:hypothetical protein
VLVACDRPTSPPPAVALVCRPALRPGPGPASARGPLLHGGRYCPATAPAYAPFAIALRLRSSLALALKASQGCDSRRHMGCDLVTQGVTRDVTS